MDYGCADRSNNGNIGSLDQVKTCCQCNVEKPLEEFSKNKRGLYGRHTKCKQCYSHYRRQYYLHNKQRHQETGRRNHLQSKYGLSVKDYEEMIQACSGLCAICSGSADVGSTGGPHVDHCHETGRVRGILCGNCNRGLGLFQDRIEVLRGAIQYLDKWTK